MTPTTELFYAFVNLEDTPVPCDLPEEDVFARAFKQATVAHPQLKEQDFRPFAEQDSPIHSPQDDVVFDDFLSKDSDEQGDTSPSSVSSSSTKPLFQAPKYISTSTNEPSEQNVQQGDANRGPADQRVYHIPRPEIAAHRVEAFAPPQQFGPAAANEASFPPANHYPEQSKQPRRRNTKRKLRTEEEEVSRRTAFLERNRQAAQKCRSRKKRQTNTLEDDLAIQEEINARLKAQVDDLAAELRNLKEVYLQCEQECQHAKVGGGVEKMVEKKVDEEEPEKEPEQEAEDGATETALSSEPQEEVVEAMDVS
ncbi:hypothetical protein VTL71DRAFT_15589 [Oculimacula yallundae]|uniref:BZIP domain-containing protein n=1 Tax=Oculimacula yallundae TaxID=86028 RepID=A0ABR4CH14_9HELO